MAATVFLIPTVLYEGATECLPHYILEAVKKCSVFFVENERTARRYLKLLWKEMVIDDYEWYSMKEITQEIAAYFRQKIKEEKIIGIISEAGCPGIADPGQQLVQIAQELQARVKPLVGPNSILLALMASGMNGQHFQFAGYLPIETGNRIKAIKALEAESHQKRCTQIFIETPYRNHQLMETILKICRPGTLLCVATNLTGPAERIETKTVAQWKESMSNLHKQLAIFCLQAE
ncbi:MAG: SAM-dependent methyltransferase [Bacteroidota bacterium]|nr:SAM-dependent methyltransferase [Flavisolibacter sp.]MDQ3844609.1 SAM-dependent methyltransferase [Bacteroidota bacterium]MBD0284414.1 SAM-dependent methyltransferase [Flavisolibacter sp.]MBD0297256.1 SAM-dependent methyltransferase [Flavisolibacter sp.]MBD0350056.1 SAM-dependent methyltransferase [Flavisolibacter sp.]